MPKLPQWFRSLRYRLFYSLLLRRGYKLATLGDQSYGLQWTICPDGLGPRSVIYSGGVGEDISFEHALVERFGCSITLLDPSPTGQKTMSKPEHQIPQLQYHQLALTGKPGPLRLAAPPEGGISWFAARDGKGEIEVPATDLNSLMQKNGHNHVDLLKLDIEGCEYEVIDDFLKRGIPVWQVCADFDYGHVPGVHRSQAIGAIWKLIRRGYKLIHQDGSNHTFVRPRPK